MGRQGMGERPFERSDTRIVSSFKKPGEAEALEEKQRR